MVELQAVRRAGHWGPGTDSGEKKKAKGDEGDENTDRGKVVGPWKVEGQKTGDMRVKGLLN